MAHPGLHSHTSSAGGTSGINVIINHARPTNIYNDWNSSLSYNLKNQLKISLKHYMTCLEPQIKLRKIHLCHVFGSITYLRFKLRRRVFY